MTVSIDQDALIDHIARVWRLFHNDFIIKEVNAFRDRLFINKSFLVAAIGNAVIDIERMAKWHLPEIGQEPDRHKYAGFLSKWIAKTKPIYINNEPCGTDIPIETHLINACFAYDVFGSFLELSVPEEIRKSLVYSFHFREDRGESLAL